MVPHIIINNGRLRLVYIKKNNTKVVVPSSIPDLANIQLVNGGYDKVTRCNTWAENRF